MELLEGQPPLTPTERLHKLAAVAANHLPAMVRIMLDNYCQVWLNQMTDEQVLALCGEVRKALNFVETGVAE